jgi:hypothetical protein
VLGFNFLSANFCQILPPLTTPTTFNKGSPASQVLRLSSSEQFKAPSYTIQNVPELKFTSLHQRTSSQGRASDVLVLVWFANRGFGLVSAGFGSKILKPKPKPSRTVWFGLVLV